MKITLKISQYSFEALHTEKYKNILEWLETHAIFLDENRMFSKYQLFEN